MMKMNMNIDKDNIREMFHYLVIGILTTIVSLIIYLGLTKTILNINILLHLQIANVITWIGAVIFAYFMNRKFVFESHFDDLLTEVLRFGASRVLTLVVDMVIMFVMVSLLGINDVFSKFVSMVVVTVVNYIIGKLFVFRDK